MRVSPPWVRYIGSASTCSHENGGAVIAPAQGTL